jgi:hypothetical protein
MSKYSWLPEGVNRTRRRFARIINWKELPAFVYRFDSRAPQTIRATGFLPWDGAGNISMMEHVNNAYSAGHAQAGQPTKHSSQFVSTCGYGMLKQIDPTFAQQLLTTNLYKIDTATAIQTGVFYDANDVFDRAGVNRPYATQREWIKRGGILPAAVIETMSGANYAGQLNAGGIAPDEDALQGWQQF